MRQREAHDSGPRLLFCQGQHTKCAAQGGQRGGIVGQGRLRGAPGWLQQGVGHAGLR